MIYRLREEIKGDKRKVGFEFMNCWFGEEINGLKEKLILVFLFGKRRGDLIFVFYWFLEIF